MAKILHHPAALSRAFESAGLHPALSRWIAAAFPPDNDIRGALRQLRARSREAAQNDDHMRMFLRMIETNIVGRTGIQVQAKPRLANGRIDASAAEAIEAAWAEQCERGAWDITGQHSRNGADRLGIRTAAQDGELLIRIHEGDPEVPTGFAVELIDPEALDIDYSTELANGNVVRMGVELTRRRRPVAYWVFAEGLPQSDYRNAERLRIPAADLLHVYLPEWVWASRGVPWAATALKRIKMLGGYEEAAITAARAAAVKSAVYTHQEWANPETLPAGAVAQDGTIVQDLSPGGIEVAPYGMDLKPIDWQWPNTDHGDFCKDALRGIAGGLGVSYNALANDLEGVNFSSLRQGALTERELWMQLQEWWIDWVTRPLYRRWLAYALRSGRVGRRNGSAYTMDRFAALANATYQGRRWPWVDPVKDIQAARKAVALGTRSVSDIIRESGRDPEEVWEELSSDLKTLAAMGLSLTAPQASAAAQANPAPNAVEPIDD